MILVASPERRQLSRNTHRLVIDDVASALYPRLRRDGINRIICVDEIAVAHEEVGLASKHRCKDGEATLLAVTRDTPAALTADAGADAHGWLQLRLGFSLVVHASMVAVAPCASMLHQLFAAHDVRISSASFPPSTSSAYSARRNQ